MGPSQIFPILYAVHKGDFLIVQSKNLDFDGDPWFLIRVQPDGSEEWISGDTKYVKWYNTENLSHRRTPATPTPTPTPAPPPPDPHFRADRTSISAGECTTLRWDVDNVKAVHLDGTGQVGHGSIQVCPTKTQTFTLEVIQRDDRRTTRSITIQVSGQVEGARFSLIYRGCIGHNSGLGWVKGQVLDRNGHIIVDAYVEILVEGQSGVVPPARSNEQGWYEWPLASGQKVRFVSLTVNGQRVSFSPPDFEVRTMSGCFQRVDFVQR